MASHHSPEAASWPVVHARIAQTRCGVPHGHHSHRRWPLKELEERSWRPLDHMLRCERLRGESWPPPGREAVPEDTPEAGSFSESAALMSYVSL